ncbi:MAG: hypothetical protein A2V93_06445 [Ignavibacteria bacterium RBG_16_34_14]|nr:MAG: hypothetical protein A2V93_06445 [Ignavibacteria bacterium RBG_16_34_14]
MKIFFLCSLLFISSSVFSQPSKTGLFPEKKIYQHYLADVLSHQFSILKHFESNEWFGNIGAEKPLLNLLIDDNLYQFTIAATVFNTLKFANLAPPHVQVYTTDYLVDLFIDKELGKDYLLRFNWGHLSAHYSDDGIFELNSSPINYLRDYVSLGTEKLFTKLNGKIYLAVVYNFNNQPRKDKHIHGQFGLDAGKMLGNFLLVYFAFDFKIKAEVNYGTTKNLQAGVKFFNEKESSVRLAYNYLSGYDERGQLYNQTDDKHLIGLYLDF